MSGEPMSSNVAVIVGVVASVVVIASVTGIVLKFVFGKKKPKRTLFDPAVKVPLRIVDRQLISHDTMRLKLALPTPKHILGVSVGNHVYLSANINGEIVVRPYTPVSPDTYEGYVDFVIKVYRANVHPNFPNGGKMSQYLETVPIGHCIDIRGPSGHLVYGGNGVLNIQRSLRSSPTVYQTKRINMVCGGTGITPMYQLASYILNSSTDTTKLALIFANNSEKDILLREELEQLRDDHPNQFRLWYTVSEAPAVWSYSTGYVSEQMFQDHFYPPGDDCFVLLCGPPPMIELACLPCLRKLNYSIDRTFVY